MSDITIIGAGIIGLTTARQFALAGASVTLLEKGQPGREASWAGGGILSPLHPWRYPDELLRLAHWSQSLFPDFAQALLEETGLDPEWEKSGLLIIDTDEIGQAQAWGERWQMELSQLSRTELAQCEPALNRNISTALFLPDIAQVRNPRLLQSLRASLDWLGVRIHEQSPVTGLTSKGGRLIAVRTPGAEFAVQQAIVTAGAWSREILRPVGLDLPIQPVRGQMLLLRARPGQLTRVLLRGNRYLIPRRDGLVLAGSTVEYCGFDKSTTATAKQELLATGIDLVPELAHCQLLGHWAGLRPEAPRGVPYIGKHPTLENLYVNAGHFRNGLMLAPASAELIRAIVTNQPPPIDPAPFLPGRDEPSPTGITS